MHPPPEMTLEAVGQLTKTMDRAGVDRGVLLIVDTETINGKKIPNDALAEIMEAYPEHLTCFGSVDPHKGRIALDELERMTGDLGLKGLKLFPSSQLFYPNDVTVYPIYKKAQELDIPILFHSGATLTAGTHRLKYTHPLHLDDVAIDFPELKIIIGHMGNPWYLDTYALAERHENLYFDISGRAREYLPLVPWKLFQKKIPSKILFGTDMQHPQEEYIGEIRRLPISESFKEKILGENARKLLDL